MTVFKRRVAAKESIAGALQVCGDRLSGLLHASESEVGTLSHAFQALAGQTQSILGLACSVVQCIQNEHVDSLLPRVQSLGAAATEFVRARQLATHGILDAVGTEMKLLRQLSNMAASQSVIALKTRVVTMMTNVEVGRLGVEGSGFKYLATELAGFSNSLSEDTDELEMHIAVRRQAIEATRRVLTAELPHLAAEFTRINANLGDDLVALEGGLIKISAMPRQFTESVTEISAQIGGVIAAVQSYDITRQQLEHVREAVGQIAQAMRVRGASRHGNAGERANALAGVTIQIAQLQHIESTVANWVSQIRACMNVILKVSASELASMGPMVLDQEREIFSKLSHIEILENESKDYTARIRHTVGEHASLAQLIERQVKKASVVRQLLHLLALNSTVEASRLGARANAILEIGNGISELSAEWSRITEQSEQSMDQIASLVVRIDGLMGTFSEENDDTLGHAQAQTRQGLQSLRAAAEFASRRSFDIESGLAAMRSMSDGIRRSSDGLSASYACIHALMSEMAEIKRQIEADGTEVRETFDAEAMAGLFSSSYTTEAEREVMNAALMGTAPPPIQQSLGGNSVELF